MDRRRERYNNRMLPDWISASLQPSRKCGRYVPLELSPSKETNEY